MKTQRINSSKSHLHISVASLMLAVIGLILPNIAQAQPGIPYTRGDVFASVGGGLVDEFTPTGHLVQVLNDGTGSVFTTGMAFDAAGNLYITNFGAAGTSKLDNRGNLIASTFLPASGQTPESIVVTSSGFFTGGPSVPIINQFNTAGSLVHTYHVLGGTGTGGTDWIDFQNANTILYTGEGNEIRSYNIATGTQNPDFADNLPGGAAYALRVIPAGGIDAHDVLVADTSFALLLGPNGAILMRYLLPGSEGDDFSINLDPNGRDFWTGDVNSGMIWEVNIATGAIDNQFTASQFPFLNGIAVYGERTVSSTPEPTSLLLFGSGILGFAGVLRRRLMG